MGMIRRGASARGGVGMSRSGAETSACSDSLTSGFVSTSGWAGLSADAEVEKTKVNKQRTGAARVIWWAFMVFPPDTERDRARRPRLHRFGFLPSHAGGMARFKFILPPPA